MISSVSNHCTRDFREIAIFYFLRSFEFVQDTTDSDNCKTMEKIDLAQDTTDYEKKYVQDTTTNAGERKTMEKLSLFKLLLIMIMLRTK